MEEQTLPSFQETIHQGREFFPKGTLLMIHLPPLRGVWLCCFKVHFDPNIQTAKVFSIIKVTFRRVRLSISSGYSDHLPFSKIWASAFIVFRRFLPLSPRYGNSSNTLCWISFASIRLVALINDFHLVSPGSSFISSISATSISGLLGGEDVTDMTLDGEEFDLLGVPSDREGTLSPPPPPRNEGVPPT